MINNKLQYRLIKSYLYIGTIFASASFVLNNWVMIKYNNYYYINSNKTNINLISVFSCHIPMIPKSILNGLTWPIILSDFILYNDKNHDYEAFRHIIPWMNKKHQIVNENDEKKYIDVDERKYIDVDESLNKY